MNLLLRPVRTSVGSKYVMALTGLGLMIFVIAHMIGNLLVFSGPDALNSYAKALKDHPTLLWSARTGLLAIFVLHVFLGIRLTRQNMAARPDRYAYEDTVQANWASRHMLLTGLLLFAFVIYHLAHFTFGLIQPAPAADPKTGGADVYAMVVAGFSNVWITLSYLFFQVFLALHLWHGGSSWLQSLGLNHPVYQRLVHAVGPVVATVVFVGNCSMPLAIYSGLAGGPSP
jgi:succinate dehydrogenase / fumarate reductase cytochrome b subunit